MTRTHQKYIRIYSDGYDISGTSRQVGVCGVEYDAQNDEGVTDGVKNILIGRGTVKCGPINSFLSPSATIGVHELMSPGYGTRNIMIPVGALAVPAVGNPCFAWEFEQASYIVDQGSGFVAVNAILANTSYAGPLNYSNPWGLLLHAYGIETAANVAIGTIDNGAASAAGGVFAYQIFSSNGTVTASMDDSATNANNAAFSAVSGATSGSVDASATPKSGFIQLSKTAAVQRYLRFQVAFGTATTVTFATSFTRG